MVAMIIIINSSSKGYNYVLVDFYFCKFYHQGANVYWVNDQITPSLSQIQCISVFFVQYHTPISHTVIPNPNP